MLRRGRNNRMGGGGPGHGGGGGPGQDRGQDPDGGRRPGAFETWV